MIPSRVGQHLGEECEEGTPGCSRHWGILFWIDGCWESAIGSGSMPLIVATAKGGVELRPIAGSSPSLVRGCQGLPATNQKNAFGNSRHRKAVGDTASVASSRRVRKQLGQEYPTCQQR